MTFRKEDQDRKIQQLLQDDNMMETEYQQKVGQNISGVQIDYQQYQQSKLSTNNTQDAQQQLPQQQQQAEELKKFLRKLFQNDEINSLSDARLAIEAKFENSFKPDRDLLDFLIEKQQNIMNNNKNMKKQQKIFENLAHSGYGNRRLGQFSTNPKQDISKGGLGVRSKSNISMNEYQDQDEADVDSDDQQELNNRRLHQQQDIEQQHINRITNRRLGGQNNQHSLSSGNDFNSDVDEHLDTDDFDQMMDIDEASFDITKARNNNNRQSKNNNNNRFTRVKQSKFVKSNSNDEDEEEEEKESYNKVKTLTMIEKCKKVGRIGPLITKLHLEESKGEIRQFDEQGLDVEAISQFASVRANTAVFKGKYYYEVKLMTAGIMQIGWCTLVTPFNEQNGVGDDSTSYAYDGCRIKKWNQTQQRYGKQWQAGDIIGTLIDFDKKEITFYRNDECLGVAFRNIQVGPNMAYFPAVSLQGGQRVQFNFGGNIPFKVRQNFEVCAIQEPDNLIKGYYDCAFFLIETVKRYVMQCIEQQGLNYDQKLLVGSIIWEYLYPLLSNDTYLMEDQLAQFIFELVSIQKQELIDIVLDSWEIHFSIDQLILWIQQLMHILCRKISSITLLNSDTLQKREFELSHMKFILHLLSRQTFLYAWLCSETLYPDLENLYFFHLPNDQEISNLVPQVYHELIPGTERFKQQYNQALDRIMTNIKIQQNYWFQITDLLFQKRKLTIQPDAPMEKCPRHIYLDFLKYLAFKNVGYLKNSKPPGLTWQGTLGNIFFCAVRHMDEVVYNQSVETFPYQTFFAKDQQMSYVDDAFKHIERIGGTFTFMESELAQKLQAFRGKQMNDEQQEMSTLAKNLTLIYTYSIIQEIQLFIKANEKIYVNSRTYDDLTDRGKQEYGSKFIEEMVSAAKILPQFQMILHIENNRVNLHKFAYWLTKSLNYMDKVYPDIIYILPEEFVQIPFDIFRASKRGNLPLYESEQDRTKYQNEYQQIYASHSTTFTQELIQFISKHFFDPKIVNPDLKELYLTRLNIIMQSQIFMNIFEKCEQAQRTLIPDLMKSFDKKYLLLVSKNFLRFAKGRGFKEIHLSQMVSENTYSPYFQQKIREQLLIPGDKLTKEFMNVFFNTLNETTTELFVIFKELKNSYNSNLLKRTRLNFSLVVDLFRIMEVITRVAPELFVDKLHIHSIRLINYMMFVLHSVFIGSIDNFIDFFSAKIMQRSESLAQFLAPFIGILKNLYDAVNTLGNKDNVRYDNLADIFQKTDSFDPILFLKLKEIVKGQLPPSNQEEQEVFSTFDMMLDEIDMLCQCNKIRKHSLRSQDSQGDDGAGNNQNDNAGANGGDADNEFDEEKLCNICYFSEKDTTFIPCGHQTCYKCIQVHTQNSEKCPFCNAEIKELKQTK